MFINFSLNQLDDFLIWCVCLTISLGIIWRRIEQFNPHFSGKFLKFSRREHSTLIGCYDLWNTKLINNMFLNEFYHFLWRHAFERNRLNPFGEIICGHQDKLLTLAGRWIYLTNQINSPSSEWPWLDYWIHGRCRSSLHAPKFLAFLATFVIREAIFQHCWPKISVSPDHQFHLIGRLMGSTDPFMNFIH